ARFHFVEPFEKVKFGRPFDMPEAAVRRSGAKSATQALMARHGLHLPKLEELARMTALTEITPWMLASDPESLRLTERIRRAGEVQCGRTMTAACLPTLLKDLDEWFAGR